MTITIDQLIQVLMKEETDDAGMRAVVRAIRDDMNKDMGSWEPKWAQVEVNILFDQILGDAGEKGAGGSTREDGQALQGAAETPATAPAPAVCEWTNGFVSYENRKWWRTACGWSFYGKPPFVNCKCGKPIKFTEAK